MPGCCHRHSTNCSNNPSPNADGQFKQREATSADEKLHLYSGHVSSRYLPQQLASSQPGSPAAACFAPPIPCAHDGCLRPASPLPPVLTAGACILHHPCHLHAQRVQVSCTTPATCAHSGRMRLAPPLPPAHAAVACVLQRACDM
jgi:hypothetical protein